jgi:hypothetical protein
MRHHRNGGRPSQLPGFDSLEYRAQQLVLLEIVVDPPPIGDPMSELMRRLDVPASSLSIAVAALEVVGLAEREGDVVRATTPALYFEFLWPVRL